MEIIYKVHNRHDELLIHTYKYDCQWHQLYIQNSRRDSRGSNNIHLKRNQVINIGIIYIIKKQIINQKNILFIVFKISCKNFVSVYYCETLL